MACAVAPHGIHVKGMNRRWVDFFWGLHFLVVRDIVEIWLGKCVRNIPCAIERLECGHRHKASGNT